MSKLIEESLKIGVEEALDILDGTDSVPKALDDVYERLQELKKDNQ